MDAKTNLKDLYDQSVQDLPKNPFEKLEKRLNVVPGSTKTPTKKDVTVLKKEIKEAISDTQELIHDEEFEDKEFIREKIKSLIARLDAQLDTMEESTLIGAEPRLFEVYAKMASTYVEAIGKLMALQQQVATTISNNALIGNSGENNIVLEQKVTRKVSASNFSDLINECRNS